MEHKVIAAYDQSSDNCLGTDTWQTNLDLLKWNIERIISDGKNLKKHTFSTLICTVQKQTTADMTMTETTRRLKRDFAIKLGPYNDIRYEILRTAPQNHISAIRSFLEGTLS